MKPDKTLEVLKRILTDAQLYSKERAALTKAIEVLEGDKGLESILSNQAGIDSHRRIPIYQAVAQIKSHISRGNPNGAPVFLIFFRYPSYSSLFFIGAPPIFT